ncbi:MAG TPA: D-arabinono-1,4-lactone oxidase [Solirubrobacteraceae bacterium]|nr:D-arabinono-1,4-lactone oxidase [Solirubrobacteraceae bacterium]
MALGTNWAGSYTYRAHTLHRPATIEQLQEILAAAPRIRVLGSRHTFSDIADSDELVSLDALPNDVTVAGAGVSVGGAVRYGDLAGVLEREGLALHNLASLPHTTVAGAVATATHGSGDGNGNLATAVSGIELVTSAGEIVAARRGDPDFDGLVVNLGALGAVTRLRLDVEPAYEVRQRVFEDLGWDRLYADFDAITAAGYSVSVFTLWGETSSVWIKSRAEPPEELAGATPAPVDRHPIPGIDPVNCTAQRGVPGPWWDRLPHFRMGFTPSAGEELQSEFLVPRAHAVEAIETVRALAAQVQPVLQVSEIRTVAADRLWLSPQYGTDTIGIHFTWTRDPDPVERALAQVEAALAPFDARPHWGKLFLATPAHLYERRSDFLALAERLDPRGAFRNRWLERSLDPGAA